VKRTELKRRRPLKSKTGLRRSRFAYKVKGDSETLRRSRKIVKERSGGICEAPWCAQLATDMHHVQSRARGGSDEASNLVHLCRESHSQVHLNPEWATRQGLMKSAWGETMNKCPVCKQVHNQPRRRGDYHYLVAPGCLFEVPDQPKRIEVR
jgi:hypothetical protein